MLQGLLAPQLSGDECPKFGSWIPDWTSGDQVGDHDRLSLVQHPGGFCVGEFVEQAARQSRHWCCQNLVSSPSVHAFKSFSRFACIPVGKCPAVLVQLLSPKSSRSLTTWLSVCAHHAMWARLKKDQKGYVNFHPPAQTSRTKHRPKRGPVRPPVPTCRSTGRPHVRRSLALGGPPLLASKGLAEGKGKGGRKGAPSGQLQRQLVWGMNIFGLVFHPVEGFA